MGQEIDDLVLYCMSRNANVELVPEHKERLRPVSRNIESFELYQLPLGPVSEFFTRFVLSLQAFDMAALSKAPSRALFEIKVSSQPACSTAKNLFS
jgi:hypothetical protein